MKMKKRSKRLEPVASHAKRQEEEAAKILAEAQQRVTDSEQQLHQLESFRDEYLQKYKSAGQQPGSVSLLLDYQAFLAKINQGIGQAAQTIQLCCQQRDVLKQQWLQRKTRTQALESVVEKYQHHESRQESHREQLEMDEFCRQRLQTPHN